MAEKLKNILSLTEILLEALTAESESWKDFLVFAARLYKYPFAEQLLIYGQRPDAVACASIEVWNHRMHRWVNRYAKGIALLDDSQSKMRLKYVFDFLDTHPGRDAKLPYLWKIREDQQRTIQTEMAQKLELDIEGEESFFHSLEKLCLREVYERIESYVGDFSRVGHDYETEPLLQLLSESVTYAVTSRCGIVPPEYNFDGLREFRTTEEISVLGTIVSELSKDILTEIRQIVATIERNEDNHKFAELLDDDYNEYNPEIDRSVLQAKEEPHDERDYLQSDRGIFVPELDRTDGRRYPTEQVWPEIQELFDGTSEGILQPTVIIGDIESASGADRRNNEPENRTVDTRVGAKRRHRRDAERDRSDEMGGAYEQYQAGSRGNDVSGIVVDETYGHEQASSRLLPPFFVGKNNEVLSEAVDCFLRSGANEKQSALRICGQYRKGKSKEENILFLQREFGNGNKGILVSGKSVSFSFSHDGVVIAEGNTTKQGNYRKISWTAMAERIAQLLEYGVYLSQEQLSQVEEQERNRVAEHLYGIYRDLPKEKRADFPLEFSGTVPEIRQYLAEQLSEREHIQSYISFLETLSPDRSERKKKQLQQELEDLLLEPIEFVASQERLSEPVLFITEDTVDEILQAGSQMENGKYRIYTFFQNESDLKMRTNFLKNEYGTGGYSNGWRSVMYDSKGISVSQSATLLAQPYGEKKLTWEQAAKRIERLIDTNRYINANELKSLADYLQEHDKSTQDDEVEEQAKITAATEPYEIGMHVYIDAKRYELGDITYDFVYLYDSEQTLFPLEYPRQEFEKQMEENPLNQIRFQTRKYSEETERPTQKVVNDEHIKQVVEPIEKLRYKITNETLGYGGAKEKYQANINAIRLLRTLEVEHRSATKEEQEVLAQYVGWGSLPMAFDEANATWSKEYQELKSILSEKEYKDARASTLNAHYTSPTIIRAIYQCIEKLGFRVGNLLEPSCGVGNFFGLLPESMQEVKLYGVELESIAGRIAKELYQDANITIAGFQETVYPDNFFDVAIGNVPFGQYQVSDKRYDHLKFSIHDYFFAKSLDQVRPGGVIAFITSHYTMDKKSENVRRYLAQRAVLLGAIRLPNNAFKANAGAEVVADILFLQKRERPAVIEESWVALGETNDGFKINQYFVDHPEMILGELKMETTQYGREECTCLPLEGVTLQEQLQRALLNIHGLIETREIVELEEKDTVIPADPTVQNFSYTIVDEGIYYRENSRMYPVDISEAAKDRIKEMIGLRECVRKLIAVQMEDVPDQELLLYQNELNVRYDQFQAKYGLLNASANNKLFRDDSSYPLLCSLEHLDEQGNLRRKADIFTKRTIRAYREYQKAETANEALLISLTEKAKVDLPYMRELLGEKKSLDDIKRELEGVIFKEPLLSTHEREVWQTADEYLSGDVRKKLKVAQFFAEGDASYIVNVEALKKVQPVDLSAAEIDVRLGTTWIPAEVVQEFVYELLNTPAYIQKDIRVLYLEHTAEWQITHKSFDRGNVQANTTYGTERANAYRIIEDSLNLRDTRIYDYEIDSEGRKHPVLNKDETVIAQGKQAMIKQAFRDWIWQDQERRTKLVDQYNNLYNSVRPREYDGSHLNFPGMNSEIQLRQHQKNAVARILYGGNALLAHVVGAGKTFTMVAAAQESKRLGLSNKSLFIVPNHLVEQWASEYLQLYPTANILVTRKKDFEKQNRKKFCSRIATGDYDAIIMGHTQFEKIPMSKEYQEAFIEKQINDILVGIAILKEREGERFQIKALERSKKSLEKKLNSLLDDSKKDDVITFEALGVDKIFVDEAHYYKNLAAYSKMRNVAGISQTEAQKSSDLFMKCRYLDEQTGGKGIVFATGTPISNSMVELYTMQRYLQYSALESHGIAHFDCWASTFGETVTAIELAPEGYTLIGR